MSWAWHMPNTGPSADAAQQVLDLRSRRTPAVSRVEAATARYDQLRAEIDRIHGAAKKKRGCEEARPRLEESLTSARATRDTRMAEAQGAQRDWEAVSGPNPEIQAVGRTD